jgi:quinone-modifying oxidoreductase subunit QmoA
MTTDAKPILVIGGGIAGMTAAVEAAEVGYDVILVEKDAVLGGRVVRSHQYFPKMCPPTCGFEINARRIRQNPRITVHTLATVEEITGTARDFKARIKVRPRYVTGAYSLDDSMAEGLTSERPDEFNLGMGTTKPLYQPHDMAYPSEYVLDKDALADGEADTLLAACPPGSIDLDMAEEEIEVEVGAVVLATGWRPYDANNLENLGYARCENVVTNVELERLAARGGPTGGVIQRPSDGEQPKNVAFVQCAGSRDTNHLSYCSAVCCMGSLKQVRYLREKNPEAKATVFYIDIRTIGYLEDFYYDLLDDENVSFVKGKVAEITQDDGTKNLMLDVEDTISGHVNHEAFDMAVLATGVVPNTEDLDMPFELGKDEYGFLDGTTDVEGVYAAGCVRRPCDVSRSTKDATAAALHAIQCLKGGE